jgi:hypothetical protein
MNAREVSEALKRQMAECDHRPFIHNLLSDRWECLCGKTMEPVPADCPCLRCKPRVTNQG